MNLKSEIAPKGLEFEPTKFVISGKNATILTVISYPKYINPIKQIIPIKIHNQVLEELFSSY